MAQNSSFLTKSKDTLARFLLRRDGSHSTQRYVWNIEDVMSANLPASIQRTYLEHTLLRSVLSSTGEQWRYAFEVGCGFGRNIPILEEFANTVVGYERESHFRSIAQALHPKSVFLDYPLSPIDESTKFGFCLFFTVLQHMVDSDAQNFINVAKKLTEGGYILLVEDDNNLDFSCNSENKEEYQIYMVRKVETYQNWMSPFKLVNCWPRPFEATYTSPNSSGTFMLFRDER